MSLLPQPPADAPAPPPSRAAILSRSKNRWIWTLGLLSMAGFGLSSPLLIGRGRHHGCGQTEEVNNARQIGIALFEFQTEYGSFPDPATRAAVIRETGSALRLETKTSNDFFRQLVASGIASSEPMFYCKTQTSRKPDGLMDDTHLLSKNECGFTYFLGATEKDNLSRPLVVAPMIPGTDRFDPKPYEGKAVILKMDNSVGSYRIDKNGHVIIAGRNLMDPHHPIWDGHAPVIAWPDQ